MTFIPKIHFFYFSGTGNSAKVTEWFSAVAEESGTATTSTHIAFSERRNLPPPDPEAMLVFVSPIHGFNYPPVMLEFIRHFPKGKNKVVLMNTRAGMKIGSFVTPGVTGIAFYLSALLLWIKGYRIRAIYPVDLPSNWISLHPGLNAPTVKYLHTRCRSRVERFASRILQGKSRFRALWEFWDLLLAPVAVLYYFIGRFFLAKTYYASSECNHCGLCVKSCPVGAVKMKDGRPFWTYHCESCMKCMSYCPVKAIETGHGYIAVFCLGLNLLLTGLLYPYAETLMPGASESSWSFFAESALFVLLMGAWYRLIHYLLRFKRFERLIVYTSLTKYKFWGRRYRALKEE